MKISITYFSKNNQTGHARIRLHGPQPTSGLDEAPELAIEADFMIKGTAPAALYGKQVAVLMPGNTGSVLVATETHASSNLVGVSEWPEWNQYLPIVARLLANMAACADLQDLSESIPVVNVFEQVRY